MDVSKSKKLVINFCMTTEMPKVYARTFRKFAAKRPELESAKQVFMAMMRTLPEYKEAGGK